LPLGASERPVKIVAFGDSFTAGLGVATEDAFPAKLAQALQQKGIPVEVVNAGVPGQTASDGASRLDRLLPDGTDGVILELGTNDAMRGVDPRLTRAALNTILRRLTDRHIAVLLTGMRAPLLRVRTMLRRSMPFFPILHRASASSFIRFSSTGYRLSVYSTSPISCSISLMVIIQMPPGVEVIVARMLPKAEELVAQARSVRGY